MGAAEMKAGHTEEYVDGTSAAPWPQLDGVRPKTSPASDDDGRTEDGEGRGGAKYNMCCTVHAAKQGWHADVVTVVDFGGSVVAPNASSPRVLSRMN